MSPAAGDGVSVSVGDRRYPGQAVDLRGRDVASETVAAAVRTGASGRVTVTCPDPRPVHEHVGCVRPSMGLRVRTALAAAARSRGATAPQDDEIRTVRDRLSALEVPDPPETAAARRRVAGTESTVERIRERVAALRGRLQEAREAGRDTGGVEAELADATRKLSERETERAAAQEALERAQRRARAYRDARDRRRRLEDRLANLERAARADLVDRLRGAFADAVAAAPGGHGGDPFDADPVTTALAVGRVADLRAPVVIACDRFGDPVAAADWLGAPVVRV